MADESILTDKVVKYNSEQIKPGEVDSVFRNSPMGSISTAIGDNIRGINHRQAPSLIKINKDQYGLTFFTRPRMNLSDENIRVIRKMSPLLNTVEESYQRIIRCWLDPVNNKNGVFTSPFVDASLPFIPLLSNSLLSLPGWPDMQMQFFTSHEGVMKEQYFQADGTETIYRQVDLTANFRNITGDPISALFGFWLTYMRGVYMGDLIPHPEMMINNEMDYNLRIYRLVLDETKRYVLNIGCTGAGAPASSPNGAKFNFVGHHENGPINTDLNQVSVHFMNVGIEYDDPILAYDFNATMVKYFNPGMGDDQREGIYHKLSFDEVGLFNFQGYPRINLDTYELEWWVRKSDYAALAPLLKAQS